MKAGNIMPYCALYRQWRPKDFSHVVGQRAIIDTLRNQVINDRIAHAYLFCGSRGTGKTSTAKILARAINCEHPVNGDPCGQCPNCIRMEREESLDITEIDAASNNGVDEMRDLRDSVKYPPQYGKYRVYIIDEVHMLSTSAFNALLKTLEEPPSHIVFILATTEPQKLPETILSRCQRFDFGRLSVSDIQNRLREASEACGASVSNGALMVIARAAEGGMRDALSILDMCLGYGNTIDEAMVRGILGTSDQAFLFRYVQMIAEDNAGELFRLIDEVMRDGRDPGVFVKDITYHIRTLLLAKICPKELADILDLTEEDSAEFIKQAESFTITRLMKILDLYMAAESDMRYASSPRLALENVSLKCCIRTNESDPKALLDRIEDLEKRINLLDQSIQSARFTTADASQEPSVSPAPKAVKPNVSESTLQKKETNHPGKFGQAWSEMLVRFKKNEPFIWSMLSQGSATCDNQNIIHWHPAKAKGTEFFVGPLNTEEKKGKILNSLRDISGEEFTFIAEEETAEASTTELSDDEYINNLYKTFGREPVDIVEKL